MTVMIIYIPLQIFDHKKVQLSRLLQPLKVSWQ